MSSEAEQNFDSMNVFWGLSITLLLPPTPTTITLISDAKLWGFYKHFIFETSKSKRLACHFAALFILQLFAPADPTSPTKGAFPKLIPSANARAEMAWKCAFSRRAKTSRLPDRSTGALVRDTLLSRIWLAASSCRFPNFLCA